MKLSISLSILISVTAVTPVCANRLNNPGFETAPNFANWTTFGNVSIETWASHSGTNGAALQTLTAGNTGGFYQDRINGFSVGRSAVFAAFLLREPGSNPGIIEIKLEFLDIADQFISTVVNSLHDELATPDVWVRCEVRGIIPAGTAKVRSTVYYTANAPNPGFSNIKFDDTVLSFAEIVSVTKIDANTAEITWDGGLDHPLTLQRSTNLIHWTSISTNNATGSHTDPEAPADKAFYRMLEN